ncbi:MAG: hypothetical protein U9R58_08645 [Chloroflexota bacterium]|nr:hypothetical protein [Chloroflexota bacterium]
MRLKPTTPKHISEYARACLISLAGRNLGKYISIGGAFGLAYYYEYRSTHDIDAWWEDIAGNEDRRVVIDGCIEALHPYGNVHTREWGDVVSIELIPNGETQVKWSHS